MLCLCLTITQHVSAQVYSSESTTTFPSMQFASRSAIGDFDGDGDADVLYQTGGNGSAWNYARALGNGTFQIETGAGLPGTPFAGITQFDFGGVAGALIRVRDFDGDGDVDVWMQVAPAVIAAGGRYLRNENNTSFIEITGAAYPFPAVPFTSRTVLNDFDGDGDVDILYQSGGNGSTWVYGLNNSGTYTYNITVGLPGTPFAGVTQFDFNGFYRFGDFDGDRDIDILFADFNVTGHYLVNNNNTSYSDLSGGAFPFPVFQFPGRSIAGDFDSDGDADLLYQSAGDGSAWGYVRSDGATLATIVTAGLPGTPFSGITQTNFAEGSGTVAVPEDYDGDSDVDVWLFSGSSQGTYLRQNENPPLLSSLTPADNATGIALATNLTIVFTETVVKGTGNIYIVRTSDNVVVSTIAVGDAAVTGSGTTWVIDPPANLAALTAYAIRMDAGVFKRSDNVWFMGISDNTTWNFVTVNPPNQPPVLTNPATLNIPEDVTTALSGISVSDPDAGAANLTLTLTVPAGALAATSGGGVTVGGTATALTLTGPAANINTFITGSSLTYTSVLNTPGNVTLSLDLTDNGNSGTGGPLSVSGTTTLNVTAVNDNPVLTVPVSVNVTEDVAGAITGISVTDADAGVAVVSISFSLPAGSFTATSGAGVTVAGSPGGPVVLNGTMTNINAFIAAGSLTFTTAANSATAQTVTVVANDNGNTGTGGALTDTETFQVTVTAVNDAPVNVVPGAQQVNKNAVLVFNTGNSNLISTSDVDAGTLSVTLTATNGTITLSGIAGLSFVTGTGTANATMTFTGTTASINTALNGLSFTPANNYFGAATFQIVTDDQGLTPAPAQTDTDIINITVNPLNPVILQGSATTADGMYNTGDVIELTITFDVPVNVTGAPTLLLETGTTDRQASYTGGSGTSTLTFSYTVQAGDASADLDYQSVNALALNGGTIEGAGNLAAVLTLPATGSANAIAGSRAIVVDGIIPVVNTVTVPANATYVVGQLLDFTVNLSEAVTITGGTPSLAITIGSTTVNATYLSGSGTAALVFRYTVLDGQQDLDGITIGAQLTANGATIADAAGNLADPQLNGVGVTTGVLVNAVGAAVTSVTVPANDTYITGELLNFTVNYTSAITITGGTPSLKVTIGSTVVDANYTTGSGTAALNFAYTVQAGELDTDGITVNSLSVNGATLKDALTNNPSITLNNIGITSAVLVDAVAPVVNSVTVPADGTYATAQVLTFSVNFSENVTVTGGTPNLAVTIGGTTVNAAYVSGSGSTALVFSYTVLAGQQDADGISIGALQANGAVLADAAGNNAVLTLNNVGVTNNVLVNAVGATVTSVTVPANDTYITGEVLSFTVNYSAAVTITGGIPSLKVTIGSTVTDANYVSGSGTTALVFTYTVLAGQLDTDGITVNSLSLNGAVLKDVLTNDPSITLNNIGNTTLVRVDAIAPAITSVSVPANGTYVTSQVLTFQVTFNENVVVTGTPLLPLTIGSTNVNAAYVSGSGTNVLTFSYTVLAGQQDLDGIAVGTALNANGGTVGDAAGNNAMLQLNNVGATTAVLVNAVGATVTAVNVPGNGTYGIGTTLTFTVNYTSAVTITGGVPSLKVTIGSTVVDALYVSGSGTTALVFTYTILTGQLDTDGITVNSLSANGAVLKDILTNDPSLTLNNIGNTTAVLVDGVAPVVSGVVAPANKVYKAGETLSFTVNFSENVVLAGGTPTINLVVGSNGRSLTYVSGSGTNAWIFSYVVQAGELDADGVQPGTTILLNGATIRDAGQNNLVVTLNNVGVTTGVSVDAVPPVVTAAQVFTIAENSALNTVVGNVAATDAGAVLPLQQYTITINADKDNDNVPAFTINPNTGAVQVNDVNEFDFETNPQFVISVTVSDGVNTSAAQTVTINLTDVVEGPTDITLSNAAINENNTPNAVIGTLGSVHPTPGATFTYTLVTGPGSTDNAAFDINGGQLRASQAFNFEAKSSYSVRIRSTDNLGLFYEEAFTIAINDVNEAPTISPIAEQLLCINPGATTVQVAGLSAGPETAQTYTLSITADNNIFDVLTINSSGLINYTVKPNTSGVANVTVTIRDNGGVANGGIDQAATTFKVTVSPAPLAVITSNIGLSISKGDIAILTATGGLTYAWADAPGIIGTQYLPVLTVRPMENTTYAVTVTTAAGCTGTAQVSVTVNVDFKLDATNILTPNGDGRNDRWVIRNIDSYPDNEVQVFDRSGRLVFRKRGYMNEWEGKVNGVPLQEGTYYYLVTLGQGAKVYKGYITIVRDNY